MKQHLSIDLETYSSVQISKSGLYKYIQSPDFEILLLAYSLNNGKVEIIDLAQGEHIPNWLNDAIKSADYIKTHTTQHLNGTHFQNTTDTNYRLTSGEIQCYMAYIVVCQQDWMLQVKL